jgi:hypothetical protein
MLLIVVARAELCVMICADGTSNSGYKSWAVIGVARMNVYVSADVMVNVYDAYCFVNEHCQSWRVASIHIMQNLYLYAMQSKAKPSKAKLNYVTLLHCDGSAYSPNRASASCMFRYLSALIYACLCAVQYMAECHILFGG